MKVILHNLYVDIIILLVALWIASSFIFFHIWQEIDTPPQDTQIASTEQPANWVSTKRVARNTYKTAISLEPNLPPVKAMQIAQYFVGQRCKQAEIKKITILYTVKTNIWVIWREGK